VLDTTQEKHRNLKRDRLIRKLPKGWANCYISPKKYEGIHSIEKLKDLMRFNQVF
jgi:hypothetical protein